MVRDSNLLWMEVVPWTDKIASLGCTYQLAGYYGAIGLEQVLPGSLSLTGITPGEQARECGASEAQMPV